MGNLQSTPSSSNTIPSKKYDVFVNFRGEDTRDCFTSHLDVALRGKQIEAFIDYQLRVGDVILLGLMGAINESKISVVIFSKDYATSKWCLHELVEILKCKKDNNQIVIPVFYWVDPSDVRHQTGSFKDSFVDHEKNSQKEVKTWRDALAEACGIKGWHSSVGRTDATLVNKIVNDIWKKLASGYMPSDFGELIGLKPRIERIISSLCLHVTTDVRIIGIWGMGGIGKTTLADAIFNQNSNQFEGVCFIQNVREKLENRGGLVSVEEEILSKVLKDGDLKLDSLTVPPKIKERLNRLKVFIILDDVDDSLNVETLVKGVDGLGEGSRIIITSRDKQVLRNCHVNDDNIYEVKGFNCHEALQLFCKYAFHENCHSEDLMLIMVYRLVNFTNGNPLALKVLGSSLYKKNKEEWESVVSKFEITNLRSKIFDVLKISYDGLEDTEKGIFLDIACFLKGKTRDYVAKILDDCYYSLSVLVDRSLIKISSYHTIEMHDLLEEMGRDIVNKESPNKIGKRSRMWRQEDVICTLKNDDGTPEVQGIVLDMNKINKNIHLSPQVFKKMYNLRLLKFYDSTYYDYSKVNCSKYLSDPSDNLRSFIRYRYHLQAPFYNSTYSNHFKVNFSEGPSVLSDELRLLIRYGYPLHAPFYNSTYSDYSKVNFSKGRSVLSDELRSLIWYAYPLQALPSNFNPNNLVELDLRGSNLERLWEDCMDVPKLRWLNLSRCTRVTKIPDLSKSPLLEMIDLEDCSSLLDFPQLCMPAPNLRWLILSGCTCVTKIQGLSESPSLEAIDLRDCSSLLDFSQLCMYVPKLRWLNLSRCIRITKIPDLSKSPLLEKIDLEDCSSLLDFPQLYMPVPNLRWLNLSGCIRVTEIQGLSKSPLLESINLKDCSSLLDFPQLAQHLRNLSYLDRSGCNSLRSFPSDIHFESLTFLDLSYCNNLTKFPQISGNNITRLDLSGTAIKELHHSIAHLNGLEELLLGRCENLETLPSGICNLTSLRHLDLSDCSRLEILPENLENLRSLEYLSADRIAICQLPYSMKRLPENLFGRTHLRFTRSTGLGLRRSLRRLFLSDCNLNYIPKDIGCLSSLVELDLSVNNFDGLPQSMMELCNLRFLHLDNCNMVVSLIDLPPNLTHLSACDCKQLQSIPNEWDFARILRTKSKPKPTEFIFTNCMNLEETAVGNMLARLVKYRHQVYSSFRFCYPGRKVAKWFRYRNEGSSIKFQKTFDPNLKGFAVCAVIAFEKYLFNGDSQHKLGVHFDGTCSDGDQSSPTNIMSQTAYFASRNRTLIDSDHVAFGYCYASNRSLIERQLKNYSFEFRLSEESPNYRLKSCGVCPIYYYGFGTDDSNEAGTSGSRFDEEESEPKRMRICRQ